MKTLKAGPSMCVLVLLLASACSHTLPAYTAKPIPPPQFNASSSAIAAPVTQAPESVLPIKLSADLTPIQRAVQEAIPDRFTDADHMLGSEYRWSFVRDGEPHVLIQDGLVMIHAPYRGDVEARGSSRGCHLDPLYPVLDGHGQLSLRQEGDNLIFTMDNPKITMDLKPESDTKCNMFNIPVKDQLQELINQEALNKQIAKAVDQAGLKIPIQQVGEKLHGPLAVSVAALNTQLCVYGRPSDVTIGTLKGTAQETTLSGTAREAPSALYEHVCRKTPTPHITVHPGPGMSNGEPYRILASIPVPYGTLNQTMQDRLFHTEVALDTMLNDKIVIERVAASDVGGRALIAVQTSGDVKGTIYYWGMPQFVDGGTGLAITDLHMANESKTALDSVKVGYWQTVDRPLKERVRRAAMVDLTQYIGKMKSAMSGQHKSGPLMMDITVARQRPERAYSTPEGLVADILFEGKANATGALSLEGSAAKAPSTPSLSRRPPAEM